MRREGRGGEDEQRAEELKDKRRGRASCVQLDEDLPVLGHTLVDGYLK